MRRISQIGVLPIEWRWWTVIGVSVAPCCRIMTIKALSAGVLWLVLRVHGRFWTRSSFQSVIKVCFLDSEICLHLLSAILFLLLFD